MNSCTHTFPCTLGDKISDSFTGITGTCGGLWVYGDGSSSAAIVFVINGELKTEWVGANRVQAAS